MFFKSCLKASPCFAHIHVRLIVVGTWDLKDAACGTKWIPLILRVHQKFPESSVGAHDRCYVMSAKNACGFLSYAFNIWDMNISLRFLGGIIFIVLSLDLFVCHLLFNLCESPLGISALTEGRPNFLF